MKCLIVYDLEHEFDECVNVVYGPFKTREEAIERLCKELENEGCYTTEVRESSKYVNYWSFDTLGYAIAEFKA